MKSAEEILKSILLPDDPNWEVTDVVCDDHLEEIRVYLSYCGKGIEVDGVRYPIFNHRPVREWRHLDLWNYKTFLVARVPRYMKDGKAVSVEVPWTKPNVQMSWLLEKNDRHTKGHKEPNEDSQSSGAYILSDTWCHAQGRGAWNAQA